MEYDCSEEDLSAYGLDAPAVTVELVYSPGSIENSDGSVHVFDDTDFAIEFGLADGTEYGRLPGSKMVYKVSGITDRLLNMQLSDLQAASE